MTDDVKALIADALDIARYADEQQCYGASRVIRELSASLEAATASPAVAVDREALVDVLDPSREEGRYLGRSHAGLVLHPRQAEAIADHLLASGVLHNVRDVQAEALEDAADDLTPGDDKVDDWGIQAGLLRARAQAIREARND